MEKVTEEKDEKVLENLVKCKNFNAKSGFYYD